MFWEMFPAPVLIGRQYRRTPITTDEWLEKKKIFDVKEGEWSWHAPMSLEKEGKRGTFLKYFWSDHVRQKTNDEARQRDATHGVFGKHGLQDGLRCGETAAHCPIMEDHDVHGWFHVRWQDQKDGLCSNVWMVNYLLPDAFEAPWLWLKMAMQILGDAEPEWLKKLGVLLDDGGGQAYQMCSFFVG